jgi:hypothetical protein
MSFTQNTLKVVPFEEYANAPPFSYMATRHDDALNRERKLQTSPP